MARIRTIKPEFATDEKLARISRDARLTFVLCITQADDDGLLPGNSRQLLAALYPLDETMTDKILTYFISELVNAGRLRWRETRDGSPILQIVNWASHQKIDHKAKSLILPNLREIGEESPTVSRESREDVASVSRSDLVPVPRTKDHVPSPRKTAAETDERFETTWSKYPKRSGGNSKPDAHKAWRARLAAGVSPDELLAGTERYAAYVRAMGKEGTEFVKQAATFFGPSEHWREPWSATVTVSSGGLDTTRAAALWARYKAAGLLARTSREALQSRGEQLVAEGAYPDYASFLAEVSITKPWEFADARSDSYAISDIAKRLAVA